MVSKGWKEYFGGERDMEHKIFVAMEWHQKKIKLYKKMPDRYQRESVSYERGSRNNSTWRLTQL